MEFAAGVYIVKTKEYKQFQRGTHLELYNTFRDGQRILPQLDTVDGQFRVNNIY